MNGARQLLDESWQIFRLTPVPLLRAWLFAEIATDAILVALGSIAIDAIIRQSGHYVIANNDLMGFVMTPRGVLVLVLAAVLSIAALAYARTAILFIAARSIEPGAPKGYGATAFGLALAFRHFPSLLRLSFREVLVAGLHASPLIVAAVLAALLTVRSVDLYWLVTTRPPRLWLGAMIVAPLILAIAALLIRRYLQWSLALPLCVLGGQPPREAMKESAQRMRGQLLRFGLLRVAWLLLIGLAAALALAGVRAIAEGILTHEFARLKWTAIAAGGALLLHAGVVLIARCAVGTGDTLLVFALWRRTSGAAACTAAALRAVRDDAERGRLLRWAVPFGAAGIAVAAFSASIGVVELIDRPIEIEVTAHRGASAVAPENTIAAVHEAMRLGADFIEIDAMRTADGAVVVFHDTDLRRLAGDPRRIADLTLEQLGPFDVGAWFGPAFAGARIPTLEAVLAETAKASPRSPRFNVELKVSGDAPELARAVSAALVAQRSPESIITALSPAALAVVRADDPQRRIGLIVTAALGDMRRLDVDLYSARAALVTPGFLADAAADGREVHVWGVANDDQLTSLVLRGVAGVITPDVAGTRARLDEIRRLTEIERLALAFRARLLQ